MDCPKCGNKRVTEGYCGKCNTYVFDKNNNNFQKMFYENKKNIPSRIDMEENDQLILSSGNYSVIKKLGRGGFGTVYQIEEEKKVKLAIKVLDLWRIKPNEHKTLIKRFDLEYKAGLVNSVNIVKSYTKGELEGNPYIIMELCADGTLADRMLEFYNEKAFTPLAIQLLKGLEALHNKNLIHRDIKPENIIFKNNNIAKLTDFGITGNLVNRMTEVNWMGAAKEIWGTPLYCAPEQRHRKGSMKKAGPGMDIFSFGVTMFEVISGGQLPFATTEEINKTPLIYEKRVDNGEFESITKYRQDISHIWETVLNKSLNPNPNLRFSRVFEIIELIESSHELKTNNYIINEVISVKSGNPGDYILTPIDQFNNTKPYNITELVNNKDNFLLTIGRFDGSISNKNDVSINENIGRHISRKHATLEFEDNNLFIRDGQWDKNKGWEISKNGTFVNQNRVDDKKGDKLLINDIIKLGETQFKLIRK